jgi:hypothetical protein
MKHRIRSVYISILTVLELQGLHIKSLLLYFLPHIYIPVLFAINFLQITWQTPQWFDSNIKFENNTFQTTKI